MRKKYTKKFKVAGPGTGLQAHSGNQRSWPPTDLAAFENGLAEALTEAIRRMGMKRFKRMSIFSSNYM